MAVSFKVPKSPKRDIIASDTFLGVDLTNTGVSIDGYRSPHAPNMVRHVPGKMRKRMGYYKDILFGTKTNVNFALGTSSKALELMPYADEQWIKLYDLNQTVSGYIYIEFDYIAEQDFYIIDGATLVPAAEPDEEGNFAHFSTSFILEEDITYVRLLTLIDQELYIKNFALMLDKDENYVWSPAPKKFVERESNDPVYGCHFLKKGAGGYDGDRVVNVNRALGTSDEFVEVDWNDYMYSVAEIPCSDQTIYVDFDYTLTVADGVMYFCNYAINIPNTGGDERHFSESFVLDADIPYNWIFFMSGGGGVMTIKNFSMVYEKDENYAWSPAPEENKEKFHIKDMYNIEPKDYAVQEAVEDDTATFSFEAYKEFDICTDDSHGGSFEYVSFDISTSLSNPDSELRQINVGIWHNHHTPVASYIKRDGHFKKQHIDFFVYLPEDIYPGDLYIKKLRVSFQIDNGSGSTKGHFSVSNINVKNFSIRDSFEVSSAWYLYHVGKDFYLKAHDKDTIQKVYEDANEHISQAFQLSDKSYIIDGKEIYEFSIEEGESINPITQDNAYIPTVTIGKEPQGGGTAYESINLLQPGFYELFGGKPSVTKYQLTFDGLDDTAVKAWVMDSNGNFVPKVEDTDFTVNRETGLVTFTTAPGESPVWGEDNVKILAYRTVDGYRDRVCKCTTGILFGIGGAGDRIFLTGNTDHPNWDFYSGQYDGTYFPDTGYSVMGSAQSKIVGYAVVSNYLATFKDGFDPSQTVFVREGDLLTKEIADGVEVSEPVFKLINTLQGEGVVAPYSFGYLQTEPVFLTKAGIYAITEQDITGEKYSQNRSFYLDGQLRKEPNMETALAVVYDNQYILALNGNMYILDGLQATRTDKSEPYATRQYAGFFCTDIPAITLWTDNGVCFGTAKGEVCRFYTDDTQAESYNDDGKPIYACWETPDLDGSLFYKNKTFRYLAVRLMKTIRTTAKIYSRKLGVWNFIMEKTVINNPIDFENLDFENFTFSVDETEQVLHTKIRVKKVDKARFRIENDKLNEPFGINDLALEYIESGNYKG